MNSVAASTACVEQARNFSRDQLTFDGVQNANGLHPPAVTTNSPGAPQAHDLARYVCVTAGALVTAYAAKISMSAAIPTGSTLTPMQVAELAGAPLIATLGVVFCHPLARMLGRGAGVAAVIAALCGAMSLWNAVEGLSSHRLTVTANAGVSAERRAQAARDVSKGELELASIGSVRPATVIEAEIKATYSRTPGLADCTPRPNWFPTDRQRKACEAIGKLGIEQANAKRRAVLDGEIRQARAVTRERRTVSAAASTIAAARLLGFTLNPEAVDLVKSLLSALLVEGVAAMLLAAGLGNGANALRSNTKTTSQVQHSAAQADVQSRGSNHRSPNEETAPTPNANPDHIREHSATPIATQAGAPETQAFGSIRRHSASPQKLDVPDAPAERLLNVLAERGGTVFGSQVMIARTMGVSASTANAVLHRLSELGRVTVEATRKGTLVTMVTAH